MSARRLVAAVQAAANLLTRKRYFRSIGGKRVIRERDVMRRQIGYGYDRFCLARHLRGLRSLARHYAKDYGGRPLDVLKSMIKERRR